MLETEYIVKNMGRGRIIDFNNNNNNNNKSFYSPQHFSYKTQNFYKNYF